ncbi:MAG: hypothetical protein O3B73_01935 [bacterium]|nr:hypothetical protein [bacterium]
MELEGIPVDQEPAMPHGLAVMEAWLPKRPTTWSILPKKKDVLTRLDEARVARIDDRVALASGSKSG